MFPLQILTIYFSTVFCNIHLKIIVSEIFAPEKLFAGIFVESKYEVGSRIGQKQLI